MLAKRISRGLERHRSGRGSDRATGRDLSAQQPRILFFNINGNGMGHLSRCLAYARRMQGRARPVFFSLASAIEIIHDMGFEGDYFVSPFWSRSHTNAWNRELALRVGLMLEEVRPAAVVFDGTWPFAGFMFACSQYGVPVRVWSNRGLHKKDFHPIPVKESAFDLVIQPGELGAEFAIERAKRPGRKVTTPPVTLLKRDELLDRDEARDRLGLKRDGRYVLFSLGPGNLKDVSDIGRGLLEEMRGRGLTVVWARAPISVRDVPLPDDVQTISVYPLARYLRAFDVFVSAGGYNACCEIVQSGLPSLLVPNTMVADDQARRADLVSRHASVVVSSCETPEERREAVVRLLELTDTAQDRPGIDLDGADRAVDEILALVAQKAAL
ncbi:MAG: glycosyltransferase [Gammaproteobacteria bacterium]|nr:glycosyltransferase [Gammaproteobacteria bacterium]